MKKFDIKRLTSLGRPLDFDYPSNLVIVLVSVIALAGGFIIQLATGNSWKTGILWGLGISISVFLSWALSRELEPLNDFASYVTAGLTLILVFYNYPPHFIGLIWVLLVLRMVNRSTGLTARWSDSSMITLISGWLIYLGYYEFTLMGALAFLFDAWLRDKNLKQYWFAIIHVILFVILFIYNRHSLEFQLPSVAVITPVVIIIIGNIAATLLQTAETATDDDRHEILMLNRIKAARYLALSFAFVITLWNGDAGFRQIMPLWSALAGSAIFRFIHMTEFGKKLMPEDPDAY